MSPLVLFPASHSEFSIPGREGWVNSRLGKAHGPSDSPTAMGLVTGAPGWDGDQKDYRAGVMPPSLLADGSLLPGWWVWASPGMQQPGTGRIRR